MELRYCPLCIIVNENNDGNQKVIHNAIVNYYMNLYLCCSEYYKLHR